MVTTILNITEIAENQNMKYLTANNAFSAIEQASNATYTDAAAGAGPVAITVDQFTRNMVFKLSGGSAAFDVTFPSQVNATNTRRVFVVDNADTTYVVTIKASTGSGASVTVDPGVRVLVYQEFEDVTLVASSAGGGVSLVDWKDSVRAATSVAGTLATSFENADTIDGVVLATGDRILLKNQAAGAENGLYTVNATGAPTRTSDADADAEVTSGLTVFVEEGTAGGSKLFMLTTTGTIIVGTTALVFSELSGSSTFLALSDAPNSFASQAGRMLRVNTGETTLEFIDRPYDVGSAFGGVPGATVTIMSFLVTRAITFPSGMTLSQGKGGTAATAQTDFDLQKNGSSFGTMRFAAAGTVASFIAASATSFAAGDELRVISPGTPDATLADLSYTFSATVD